MSTPISQIKDCLTKIPKESRLYSLAQRALLGLESSTGTPNVSPGTVSAKETADIYKERKRRLSGTTRKFLGYEASIKALLEYDRAIKVSGIPTADGVIILFLSESLDLLVAGLLVDKKDEPEKNSIA